MTLKRQGSIFAATLVILVAWGVFLIGMTDASMFIDEDSTWRMSRFGPINAIEETFTNNHPPLHYLAVWSWIVLTGTDENLFVMRLSSTVFGILAVAVTYRLGTDWFGSRWAGVTAALFLGSAGMFVFYARNLRMYALIVLLVCINWWFLQRLWEAKRGGVVGYALSLTAMAYTYYFSAFVVPAQIIITLAYYRKRIGWLLGAFAFTALAFLPYLPIFLDQIVNARAEAVDPNAPIIGKFLGTRPTSYAAIEEFVRLYTSAKPAFVFGLLAIGLTLGYAVYRARRRHMYVVAAGLWLFLTVTLFFVINLRFPVYGPRYVLTVAPAIALLAGAAVSALPNNLARLSVITVALVAGVWTVPRGFPLTNVPHQEMLRTIEAGYQPGDEVWYNLDFGAYGSSIFENMANFHFLYDSPELSARDTDLFVWAAPEDYADVNEVPRVWDARPYWIPFPDGAEDALAGPRDVTESYQFDDYTVRLYEAPPEESISIGEEFELAVRPPAHEAYAPGDEVVAKTWWRVDETVPLDYSHALMLTRDGEVVDQVDTGLTLYDADLSPTPTSQWTPDEWLFAGVPFVLPENLPRGEYELWQTVYYWQAPVPLPTEDGADRVRIASFRVE